jgi:HSP20 family protein
MTTLIRRQPFVFTSVPSVSRLMSLFDDPFFSNGAPAQAQAGNLALDVLEDDKNVIVRASLPGFTRDEIEAEIHDGVLSIKAEHGADHEEKAETYYRRERRYGALTRRIALPADVVEGETNAELKDGVLTLRIPKSPKAMPKKVKIG